MEPIPYVQIKVFLVRCRGNLAVITLEGYVTGYLTKRTIILCAAVNSLLAN